MQVDSGCGAESARARARARIGDACRGRGRRSSGRGATLALLLALIQISVNVDAATFLQVMASDHAHALMTVVDGGHVDLILSHDATRSTDAEGESVLPATAEDHVVHMAHDELAAAQKRIADPISPPAVASTPFLSVFVPAPRARVLVAERPAPPFSRRSVVLRT